MKSSPDLVGDSWHVLALCSVCWSPDTASDAQQLYSSACVSTTAAVVMMVVVVLVCDDDGGGARFRS